MNTTPSKKPDEDKPKRGPILSVRATRNIVYIVVCVWAASATIGMFPRVFGYTPPAEIHAAFMAIVGVALMAGGLKGNGDGE